MKLRFIGSGSAFTVGADNYHSNMLLSSEGGDYYLLIDCGTDARHALDAVGVAYQAVRDVYVSHLHADHAGGLEWLGFITKFDEHCPKPNLYVSDALVDDLWSRVLSGGMRSLDQEVAELSSYFNVNPIKQAEGFSWGGVQFELVETRHICDGKRVMPSFGLMFSVNGKKIFITTDTQFTPDKFAPYYANADLIFHDCETAVRRSGVHSHYEDLKTLDPAIKSKMWLYHYNPGELPDAVSAGFKGFVARGQVFDL